MLLKEVISKQDSENLSKYGFDVVDVHDINDYSLALLKMPRQLSQLLGARYQLGFSKRGTSFTDYSQHDSRFMAKGDIVPLSKLGDGIKKIMEWLTNYGNIVISSSNMQKLETYKKLFMRANINVAEREDPTGHKFLILKQ